MIIRIASAVIIAVLASLLFAQAGLALVQFDFEQPYFCEEIDIQCKDHTIVYEDGLYHVFYIQSLLPLPGENFRHEKWFGHITSPDLRHWTQHPHVLSIDAGGLAWESEAVWAPKVIKDPGSSDWLMYYTGVNGYMAQQTGLASSHNLLDWYRFGLNPLYHPGDWGLWRDDYWSNCRDPEIFHEEGSDDYYLLNTANDADTLGAISYAVSQDMANWEDLGSYFTNDTTLVMESVQLVKRNGNYHLFFTEEGEQGISHMPSPVFTGGWDKDTRSYVDYAHAAEITPVPEEELDLFSRHSAYSSIDGPIYYLRFDRIDFDTPDQVPELVKTGGFQAHWSVVFGNAFNFHPTWGDNPALRGAGPNNMDGNSYVGTYEAFPEPNFLPFGRIQGNVPTGLLRTTSFTVTGDRMSLLVGGGDQPALCFTAMVRAGDERILFWETGGDSYSMTKRLWNLESLLGESVYIVIADLSTVAWGNISVDSFEEYFRTGDDPMTPTDPMAEGPYLADVIEDAGFGGTGVAQVSPVVSSGRLLNPHPNPFNPRTRLRYELHRAGYVQLNVHDLNGRIVRKLHAGYLESGPGFFTWNGKDDSGRPLPSGVYFARLAMEGELVGAKKLVLVQ